MKASAFLGPLPMAKRSLYQPPPGDAWAHTVRLSRERSDARLNLARRGLLLGEVSPAELASWEASEARERLLIDRADRHVSAIRAARRSVGRPLTAVERRHVCLKADSDAGDPGDDG